MEHAIVLKPEVLGFFRNLPITNTLLVGWIAMGILIITSIFVRVNLRSVPGKLQNIFELIIDYAHSLTTDLAGEKKAKIFFPFMITFFFYIIVSNWLGLLPGFGTITYHGEPLLRSTNSDLNMTLALALISAITTHIFAVKYLGIKNYLLRWVALNPLFLFVGFLEIISEFTKIVSLSFRLFGNIFAGEVVLSAVSAIFAFILPLPFYFLEIVVGFVQAAVFAMLTLVFMVLLSEKHETSH
ncbi:MAG: F0F1 ATP synthase subunit A [Patescibacteria group bacterium]